MSNNTVVVGMSGGVDSSVSAYLLKRSGYNVKGLFMQNWQNEPGEECTSEVDFKDASSVCDVLDIPLHRANFSDEYWDRVFKNFLSASIYSKVTDSSALPIRANECFETVNESTSFNKIVFVDCL